jgi:hypothetical protein
MTCWITVAVASAEWKWEEIAMDFIIGWPRIQSGYDSIWVIMDRLTLYLSRPPTLDHS